MRRLLLALAFVALAAPASAQPNVRDVTAFGTPTIAGNWTVSYPRPGLLAVAKAANGDLTGTLDGKSCLGLADGQRFTLACQWQSGMMAVFIGSVTRQQPTLSTLRDRRPVLMPEVLDGTVYLPRGGDPIEPGRSGHFTGARR